jgi:hypothetical protein
MATHARVVREAPAGELTSCRRETDPAGGPGGAPASAVRTDAAPRRCPSKRSPAGSWVVPAATVRLREPRVYGPARLDPGLDELDDPSTPQPKIQLRSSRNSPWTEVRPGRMRDSSALVRQSRGLPR